MNVWKACALCVVAILVRATTAAEPPKIQALRERALHVGSYPTTRAALAELKSMGREGETAAREVAVDLLARDAKAIENAAAAAKTAPEDFRAANETLARLRPLALAHLRALGHEDAEGLAKARGYYQQLTAAQATVNAALGCADIVRQALARRPQLLELARPAIKSQAPYDDEANLQATADKALAALPALIIPPSIDLNRPMPNPGSPSFQAWHYCASRQIEAYNDAISPRVCGAPEMEHLRILNGYREALGLLPLELDPRLTLAARKHSRDMVEQNYFDHDSPDPQQKTSEMRITRAGYNWDAMAENITMSIPPPDARQAFWSWFDSPGHHRNMISAHFVAIGVGKWDGHWTQDFAHGVRLSAAKETEREKVIEAVNAELAPQR
jgi:uncharacterized protein YkwD